MQVSAFFVWQERACAAALAAGACRCRCRLWQQQERAGSVASIPCIHSYVFFISALERLDWVPVVFLQQSRFEFYHLSTTTSISFAAAPIRSPIKPTPP